MRGWWWARSWGWLVAAAMACSGCHGCSLAKASLDRDLVPPGKGWACSSGRCHRQCAGLPGAMTADGPDSRPPEALCTPQSIAYCMTYHLGGGDRLECFDTQVSCEANQRSYVAADEYRRVSPCVGLD